MLINNQVETKIKMEEGLALSESYLFGSEKKSIEISVKSLTLSDSYFQAEKIVIATDEVDCKSSSLNAQDIYITNQANFGDCLLNGVVHIETMEALHNMF
jgi:hypothetical protein